MDFLILIVTEKLHQNWKCLDNLKEQNMKLMARATQKISNFDKTYIIQFNVNCHKLVESQEI